MEELCHLIYCNPTASRKMEADKRALEDYLMLWGAPLVQVSQTYHYVRLWSQRPSEVHPTGVLEQLQLELEFAAGLLWMKLTPFRPKQGFQLSARVRGCI